MNLHVWSMETSSGHLSSLPPPGTTISGTETAVNHFPSLVSRSGGVITLFRTTASSPVFPVVVTEEEASMNWPDDLIVLATNRDLTTPLTELLLEAGTLSGL